MVDVSSFANESVFRPFNLINFTLPTNTYVTQFIDVSKYTNFRILASTDNPNLTVTLNQSVDASGLGSHQLLEIAGVVTSTTVLEDLGLFEVKSRFLRIALNGNSGDVVNLQLVFREGPLGLSNLTNVGSGTEFFVAPNSIRTLTSTDASVTITNTATEVDLSVAAAPGTSPYQQIGADITPVSPPVNAQSSGDNTNTFVSCTNSQMNSSTLCSFTGGPDYCTIDACTNSTMLGGGALNSSIQSSANSSIDGPAGAGGANNCVIACETCTLGIVGPGRAGDQNFIAGSDNCDISNNDGNNRSIISSTQSNIIGSSDYLMIASSNASTFDGGGGFQCSIHSSNGCTMSLPAGAGGDNNSIIASDTCIIGLTSGERAGDQNFIACSSTSNITDNDGNNNMISACSGSLISGGSDNSSVIGSNNCNIDGGRQQYCTIQASNGCEIANATGSGTGDYNVILGSDNCFIGDTTSNNSGNSMVILGCDSVNMSYTTSSANGCTVAAFDGLPFTSNVASSQSFVAGGSNGAITAPFIENTILGSNWSSGHQGMFMFTDGAGGTTHTSSASDSFSVRCSGGARFLSNTTNTTGVSLASGASAWAAVSDRNKKENITDAKCHDYLNRVQKLPIYEYNYKGNPKEVKCIGPMAQDWHSLVTPLEQIKERGQTRDAKDKLCIEDMDMIGVCLASIKALNEKVSFLSKKCATLSNRVEELENKGY